MKLPASAFVKAAWVRRAVVPEGDIRGDIEFQNDINGLLARMDGTSPPLTALDGERVLSVALQIATVHRALSVIRGGGSRAQVFADFGPGATVARRA